MDTRSGGMSARKNGIGTPPPPRDGMAEDWRELRRLIRELGRALEKDLLIPAVDRVFTPLAKFCLRRWR